jgi:outer membrane biosynthesis protein TonB
MNYFLKHKEGFILTIILHLLLLFIILRSEFFTPLPLPEEKGVLIDFGTSMDGMGQNEPTPKEPAPPKVVKKQETPPPVPKPQTSQPTAGKEQVMTQDYEKTAALEEAKKKEDQKRQIKLAEDKRKRDSLQKINDERIAELNRLAEIRRQDSLRKAEENARISQINSRAKNVFGASGQGTDNSSAGEGVTYKPGNQGSPDGTPGAKQYGTGGGEGVSYTLSGRSARSLPKPNYPGNEEGIVVVQITVDKYGKVNDAKAGVKGTNTNNQGLWEAARKAAISTSFNQNLDAPAFQTGSITYRFVLD